MWEEGEGKFFVFPVIFGVFCVFLGGRRRRFFSFFFVFLNHTCCRQWHDSARCTYEHSRFQSCSSVVSVLTITDADTPHERFKKKIHCM